MEQGTSALAILTKKERRRGVTMALTASETRKTRHPYAFLAEYQAGVVCDVKYTGST